MKWSEVTPDVIEMAQDLINQHHKHLRNARIGFLFREEAPISNGKYTLGKTQKVTDRLKVFMDYDFIIWLAEDKWSELDKPRKLALLDHELCHCLFDGLTAGMRHHDVEEFVEIIDRHGFWTTDLFRVEQIAKAQQMMLAVLPARGRVEAVSPDSARALE